MNDSRESGGPRPPSADRGFNRWIWHLVIGIFAIYGALINVADQRAFNLHQMGVDALVEHGTFEIGLSSAPRLQPKLDAFIHEGKILSNKQPGLSVIGAIVYFPLRAVGISYEDHYELASAIVGWIVSGGFAALGVAFFFRILNELWGYSRWCSAICGLLYGCGTTLLPYTGVLYHDTIAGALLVVAFFLLERTRLEVPKGEGTLATAEAGMLLGGVIFVSLLPLVIVILLVGYGCLWCRGRSLLGLLGGFVVGLCPLLVYNWHYFGSPLLMGYVALHDPKVSPQLDIAHMARQLSHYLWWGKVAIIKYCPLIMLGLLSLPLLWRRVRPAATFIALLTTAHMLYVSTMPTLGACQFPPRFLLVLLPFTVLPLAGLWTLGRPVARYVGLLLLVVTAGFSIGTNLLAALHGVMNCDTYRWIPARMIEESAGLTQAMFPLWQPAAVVMAITTLSVWYQWTRWRTGNESGNVLES